jgi:hypothetical protein
VDLRAGVYVDIGKYFPLYAALFWGCHHFYIPQNVKFWIYLSVSYDYLPVIEYSSIIYLFSDMGILCT